MNALLHASNSNLWSLAGWTMVHFLWLGAIVAAVAVVARVALRRASPNIRYAIAIGSLIALVALPAATAAWLLQYSPPLKGGAGGGIRPLVTQVATASPPTSIPTNQLIELHTTDSSSLADPLPPFPLPPSTLNSIPSPLTTLDSRLSTLVFYLPWLWLIGTPLTFALLVSGVVGTRRLGRSSHTIDSDPIVELLAHLASSLRITRRVTVAVCDRIASPVLIGIIRPMILLPPAALTGWSPDEIEMVLLHELAHVRRWDNFVNLLQRCIESLLFFHPAVWLISSWARREREACCDATVVARTNRPHAYAELLVALAAQLPRSVLFHPAASSAMSAGPLRSRIRQILKLEDDPMLVSGKSLVVGFAAVFAVTTALILYLPTMGHAEPSATESTEHTEKERGKTTTDRQAKPESNSTAEFPYQVQFEKGASKFLDGDEITIDEIRGTAKEFEPGNKYQIKGKYKLHSHPSASLSAYTTAKEAKDGYGPSQSVQTKTVSHGEGDFTLILPMTVRGWPHVSFYGSGGGFGGIYFGTGDSVLKEWWGSEKTAKNESKSEDGEYPYQVQLEKGVSKFLDGDETTIDEIRGTAKEFEPGTRFEHFEKSLKTIELVIAVFNDSAGYSHQLEPVYKNLIKDHHSLDLGGLKVDPKSPDAERYHLTGAPTCIVFRNGQEISRLAPIKDAEQLKRFIQLATGARKVTVKPDGSMLAEGLESYRATPDVAESEKHGASTPSSKFPSLENQKLADLAYKRLGLELEPIEEVDLNRIKALGYDGGVKVTSGTAGLGNNTIIADDILVGLGVWPTSNMKTVGEILTRPEIAELNPVKFYVVRAKDLAASRGGSPDIHDVLESGRVEIRNAGVTEERDSTIPPAPLGVSTANSSPYQPSAPETIPGPFPIRNSVGQPPADASPYAAPVVASSAMTHPVQPAHPHAAFDSSSMTAQAAIPTPSLSFENSPTSVVRNGLTSSAERLEETMKRKSDAMDKRLQATDAHAIEKAKQDLEAANKQLEEAKREFEREKRLQETLDTEKYYQEHDNQRVQPATGKPPSIDNRPSSARAPSDTSWSVSGPTQPSLRPNDGWNRPVVSIETGQPSVPTSNRKTPGDSPPPADLASTPEQILTAPKVGEIDTAPKHDASLLTPAQPHPYDIAAEQTTPKDTPTADAHSNPSIGAHHDDNSSDSRSRRSTRPDTSRPRPPSQSVANSNETPSDDRILVVYNIPAELVKDVNNMRNVSDMHGEFGSGGRYFLQATPELQKRFQGLLDATPKWRDAEKVKSRAKQVYAKTEKDGQEYLEWQPAGLTFTSRSNPQFATPAVGGGGWTPNGVVVAEVAPGSPADWNGIESGDVMTKAGKFETRSLAELESLLKTQGQDYSKTVQCLVHRIRGESFYAQLNLAIADAQSKPSGPISDHPAAQAQTTNASKASTPSLAASTDKSALRYDGKSFDEWRETWKTELSTEKRTEAIKALAAFGANGYGNEAAESILDVASNYDFDSAGMDKHLGEAIVNALGNDVPVNDWRPLLRSRYDKDPAKWAELAVSALRSVRDLDKASSTQNRDFLAQIARLTNQPTASNAAFDCLIQRYPDTPETSQLLQEKLKDKTQLANVVSGYAHTSAYPPEIVEMLLHGDPQQQTTIRSIIERFTNSLANKKLAAELIRILEDAAKPADHLAAIRGLAVIGRLSQKPAPETVEALKKAADRDSTEQRVAAGCALESVTRGTIQAVPFLEGKVQDANGKNLDPVAIQSLLHAEKVAVFGESH